MKAVVLVLSAAALPQARRVADGLGADLHGLKGRVERADLVFAETLPHVRALFAAGRPVIGFCAAGILIRAVAPLLADKRAEPPLIAVAGDGSAAVPLLGGHHGANALAARIAAMLGGVAAITTAGDVQLGIALDEPPAGWSVANPEAAKAVAAELLAGHPVRLEVEAGDAGWLSGLPTAEEAEMAVRVADHEVMPGDDELLLHPPSLALGVGCERDCDPQELWELVTATLDGEGLSPASVACVVSVDVKADEPAVHALAQRLGVPARFFPPARLEEETPRLVTPSEVVFAEVGCHGVSEAAALAAVGPQGELVVPKAKSKRATCAVARAPGCIEAASVGRPRGKLWIVGIGPGTEFWRTPEASRAIADSDALVGYGLYLDLLGPLAEGKPRHESGLGSEEVRARKALDLAAEGQTVSLVCSGDAGIYALATLVFELLDRENRTDWNRLDVVVTPGVSALQAAAARIGAPINHDFCTISLSDLLTPWEVIEQRLRGAALADFVVAFYNPVSQRRRDQLAKARDILLTGRPGSTPVILARQLGRPEEEVTVIRLDELTPDHADMLTLVMVGNKESRVIDRAGRRWVYTPRGYAKKMG